MSRRKKLLVYSGSTVIALAVVAFFSLNAVLDRASRRATGPLVRLAHQQGIKVVDPSFRKVRLSGWMAATWSDVQAGLQFDSDDLASDRLWWVNADRLRVKWTMSGLSTLSADRVVIGGNALTQDTDSVADAGTTSDRRMELTDVRYEFEMELFDPSATIRRLAPEFKRLATTGETALPLELAGALSFPLKGKPAEVRILVRRGGDVSAVVLEPQDVKLLSERFDEQLTEAEADLVAQHALRAIRLLQIKDRAESTSAQAHEEDAAVPQDAYRHVLWSFLLTRAYGVDFAEQVGDAHETGDTGNTPAERQMDLHNNAIGRKYGTEKTAEADVLPRLLDDPDVIRVPRESESAVDMTQTESDIAE